MSWRKDKPGEPDPPRGYHHGNLREALIRAALELIATKGTAGFTFAEAARFAGRQPGGALSAFSRPRRADGERGVTRLRAVRGGAWRAPGTPGGPTPSRRSIGSARPISTSLAASRPSTRPCSKRAFRPAPNPPLREAGDRAFAVLRGAAEAICAAMPAAGRPPALMVALHIWTMAHGVASLFGRADGAQRAMPMSPQELLEAQRARLFARARGRRAAPMKSEAL